MKTKNANAALLCLSSVEMRRRIGSRELSPVELLEACIARIEAINPAVNAVTATCFARARMEAKAAEKAALAGDALGLLHGLPTGIKDLEETGGLLTTYGSPLYKDFIPERDNTMVARVRKAGEGRNPTTPLTAAGMRKDPPVSDPVHTGSIFANGLELSAAAQRDGLRPDHRFDISAAGNRRLTL